MDTLLPNPREAWGQTLQFRQWFQADDPRLSVVGRRGTNQLRPLERYRDVLDKHTTGIPPPTALAEGTALSALVEGVLLG